MTTDTGTWQLVDYATIPVDTKILAYAPNRGMCVASWSGVYWADWDDEIDYYGGPRYTHWRPLPDPPDMTGYVPPPPPDSLCASCYAQLAHGDRIEAWPMEHPAYGDPYFAWQHIDCDHPQGVHAEPDQTNHNGAQP